MAVLSTFEFHSGNLADLESDLKAEETLKAQCEQNLQDLAAKLGQKKEQVCHSFGYVPSRQYSIRFWLANEKYFPDTFFCTERHNRSWCTEELVLVIYLMFGLVGETT